MPFFYEYGSHLLIKEKKKENGSPLQVELKICSEKGHLLKSSFFFLLRNKTCIDIEK